MSTVDEPSAPAPSMVPPNPDYPARYEIDYPEKLSRLLLFFRGILLIPHYLALLLLFIGGLFAGIGAWFSVLFTGRLPEGIFNYGAGLIRWVARVNAYYSLMTDKYPPFSLDDDPSYPARVQLEYPSEGIARWRALLQWLLAYPAAIAAGLIGFLGFFCVVGAWFAILFTGRYPEALFRTVAVAHRWQVRTTAYQWLMTEKYPPFVWA